MGMQCQFVCAGCGFSAEVGGGGERIAELMGNIQMLLAKR